MKILYEDNHLLVVIKPAGMPSQEDASHDPDLLTVLKAYLKEKYAKPGAVYLGLVHRLDRPASGVMVFAKTSKAASRLFSQMQDGTFQKTYYCVVKGSPEASGVLEDWLLKDEAANRVRAFPKKVPGSKFARLTYEVLDRKEGLSLLRVQLETGRSHQIRVQFSSRGWPLYSDARYGDGEKGWLALFSQTVRLQHPTKKEEMVFSALPEDPIFQKFLL